MSLYNKIIDLQKLNEAWQRVRKNKPSAGVDHVTCEQFDENKEKFIKDLYGELKEHRYSVLPVKNVTIYRGEKARKIALYSMRDKVVQQSLAVELTKIFDPLLSDRTCAYRNDKSALSTAEEINKEIVTGQYTHFLKADISSFFDEIQWKKLVGALSKMIREEDVLHLIRESACAKMLDEDSGELEEKRLGIHQGSSIAPILSNVYMMEFDHFLEKESDYFTRYSDDILILGKSEEKLDNLLKMMTLRMQQLGLRINQKKTMLRSVDEGVDFLGYHFDSSGKSTPAKAEENLQDRLETMWITGTDHDIKEKIKKAMEIIGGWKQYFRNERTTDSIFEYVSIVFATHTQAEYYDILCKIRPNLTNIYKDICEFLSSVWREHGNKALELFEYEQFYQMNTTLSNGEDIDELLDNYRKFFIYENAEIALEIMQCYTDIGEYEKASFWSDKKNRMDELSRSLLEITHPDADGKQKPIIGPDTGARVKKYFVGREDIFSVETIDETGKRKKAEQLMPLTDQMIDIHLSGNKTYGSFVQRSNCTVKFIVFDVDISKRVLLKCGTEEGELSGYMNKAFVVAQQIKKTLRELGLNCYIEYSGYRGYHVWLLLSEWIRTRYANLLCDIIDQKIETDDDIIVEEFPNKTRIKQGKNGQAIKIPFGVHPKTGNYSYFIEDDGEIVSDINAFMDSLSRYSSIDIKRILARYSGSEIQTERTEVDKDLSPFGNISASIEEVLEGCNLMRYLCQKSVKTGYLTHFERLSVLYVFGHLGEDGCEFIHKVMSFTMNYNYNVTEKFIRRCPEKPISCLKLRDQYKRLTGEIGCSCVFKGAKNCYPSPVMHAIEKSDDIDGHITLPTNKTYTKEAQSKMVGDINVHKISLELAKQLMELKKQRRGIDKKISKIEDELSEEFDRKGMDELELEIGVLVRKKVEGGYDWVIEM